MPESERVDTAAIETYGEDLMKDLIGETTPAEEEPPTPAPVETPAPVAEEPPVPETAPNEVAFDWMKETGFESKEAFDTARTELSTTQARIKALEGVDPSTYFANDDIKKLNSFTKQTGISNTFVYQKLSAIENIESLPVDEQIALAKLIDYPNLTPDEYQALKVEIQKEYGINSDKWMEEDSEYRPSKSAIATKMAAADAAKKISEITAKISTPETPTDYQERIAAIKSSKESWEKVSTVLGGKDFAFELPNGDKKIGVTLPAQDVGLASKAISKLLIDGNIPFDDNSQQTLGQLSTVFTVGRMAMDGRLAEVYRGKMLAELKEQVDKEIHNPEPLGGDNAPPATPSSDYEKDFNSAFGV